MPNMFHAQLDLDLLADKLAPLIFERLNGKYDPATGAGRQATADDWPEEPTDSADADPWGSDDTRPENRSQGRSGSRSGNSGRSSGGNRGGRSQNRARSNFDVPESGQHEDRMGKLWEFGLEDAPECDHGLPAAEVTKPRAKWRAWACPLGFGKDYKQKCDLWEYQS